MPKGILIVIIVDGGSQVVAGSGSHVSSDSDVIVISEY